MDNVQDEANDCSILMHQYGEMTRSCESLMEMEESTTMEGEKRPNKRNRGLDQEELWTTIGRKGKRFARAADIDDSTRISEDNIEVCLTSSEKLPKQFKLAKSLKAENIQDVIRVKYINSFKVLVQFSKEESADSFISTKAFNENGMRCQKTFEVNQSYGVIKDIDIDLTDEEILESLSCETLIIGARRLKRKNNFDGRWETSESVRICFKGATLPSHVYIFDTRANISPYVYPVTQCSHCWRYGHSLKTCSSIKAVCPKCGGDHANCETTRFTCNNCGGPHMALAKVCPIFIKEKQLRELMAEVNCSYKQALSIYKPLPPPPEHVFPTPSQKTPIEPVVQPTTSTSMPSKTYANVLKEKGSKVEKSKKKPKQKNKSNNLDNSVPDSSESNSTVEGSESENLSREPPQMEERQRWKERISWQALWTKLKEKILENNIPWEEKIKNCVNIIYEGAISYVVQHISDWPCLSFLSKYG